MRRVLICVAGWLAAVVIATAVGFAAISLVGGDVGAPVSGIAVVAAGPATSLTTDHGPGKKPRGTDTTSSSSGSGSSSQQEPAAPAATQVTDGGSVTARCRAGGAQLVAWSPANGWSVGAIDTEGSTRQVVFRDGATDLTVDVSCVAGRPTFVVSTAPTTPEPSESPTPTSSPTDSIAPGEPVQP